MFDWSRLRFKLSFCRCQAELELVLQPDQVALAFGEDLQGVDLVLVRVIYSDLPGVVLIKLHLEVVQGSHSNSYLYVVLALGLHAINTI